MCVPWNHKGPCLRVSGLPVDELTGEVLVVKLEFQDLDAALAEADGERAQISAVGELCDSIESTEKRATMKKSQMVTAWLVALVGLGLAAACFSVCSVMLPATRAEAGSLVVPAWSFARGNARVYASPDQYADAGPVVGSGPEQPWGWKVEYDIVFPVTGDYTFQICYAAAEARPMEVSFDDKFFTEKICTGVTFAPSPLEQPAGFTWNSSGAMWEGLYTIDDRVIGLQLRKLPITKGKHTLQFARRGPPPHLVALRFDTPMAFPEDWKPPQYEVADINSISAEYRAAFQSPNSRNVANLPLPLKDTAGDFGGGSWVIPAWTFDRGNGKICASPDQYADFGPVVGNGPRRPDGWMLEYDIDFPVSGEYGLDVNYTSAEARPTDLWLDNKRVGTVCNGVTYNSSPNEYPVRFTWNSSGAVWGRAIKLSVTKGKHTVKFTRGEPLPHLISLRLQSQNDLPKDWKPPHRKVQDLNSIPAAQRAAFLPPGAVNIGALRLSIQDMMATFGPRYPGGEEYLKQLSGLEEKQSASENDTAEDKQKIEDALVELRRRAMLAHPALNFDKLLFLKRPTDIYGHTYADQNANKMGGNLCILSPVAPDGKVTSLVPELDGGLFNRFDLSFDAKKVVFSYKMKDKPFRIYEISIDPSTALMVPGSLRQLTFGGKEEAVEIRKHKIDEFGWFDDLDPCYLPNGKIILTSTRAMRHVFCAPLTTVTTLYVMDANGANLRRLSESPVNETSPSMLDDGRVIYTRWEYVDKGLGNGAGLWTVHPDGSGVDHLYKNNTVLPAGLSCARDIPGSRLILTVGGTHHFTAIGPVILLDPRLDRLTTEAMTCITPEIGYPSMGFPITEFGFFTDPYPFSEKIFLVSHNPTAVFNADAGYGIYVLDAWGNRAELYRDPKFSCFEPFPLRPRRKPPEISPVIAAVKANAGNKKKMATLSIQNVYEGMTGIERGRVKYVRVMGALPWPWGENGISWELGLHADPHRKKVYGVAKVHEDGSAYFSVPANENLLFQTLDENFMALQQMPTFINLMPGEQRSCIGCHEPRSKAPSMARAAAQALSYPAQALTPQPGDTGPRMVHYAADVQPTLDKHCIGCHSGEKPKGRLDLTDVPTEKYNRSYENIINRGLVKFAPSNYGKANFRAVPPLTRGSLLSELVERIRQEPCKANLTREEFIKIVTWIDANVPYYGTYRGTRDLKDKDKPNFRPLPLAEE